MTPTYHILDLDLHCVFTERYTSGDCLQWDKNSLFKEISSILSSDLRQFEVILTVHRR